MADASNRRGLAVSSNSSMVQRGAPTAAMQRHRQHCMAVSERMTGDAEAGAALSASPYSSALHACSCHQKHIPHSMLKDNNAQCLCAGAGTPVWAVRRGCCQQSCLLEGSRTTHQCSCPVSTARLRPATAAQGTTWHGGVCCAQDRAVLTPLQIAWLICCSVVQQTRVFRMALGLFCTAAIGVVPALPYHRNKLCTGMPAAATAAASRLALAGSQELQGQAHFPPGGPVGNSPHCTARCCCQS